MHAQLKTKLNPMGCSSFPDPRHRYSVQVQRVLSLLPINKLSLERTNHFWSMPIKENLQHWDHTRKGLHSCPTQSGQVTQISSSVDSIQCLCQNIDAASFGLQLLIVDPQ